MSLRNYKITYQIFNFFNKKKLKHNLPLFKKHGIRKKYYSSLSSEDFRQLEAKPNIHDQVDSAINLPKNDAFLALEERFKTPLLSWSKNGYAILENFFSEEEVAACNTEIDTLLQEGKVKFKYNNKIMFAFHKSSLINNMGTNEKMNSVLKTILGKKASLFQSINFLTGSQQNTHSDSIHMTTFPYGNLIAVWVALEDISIDSGPLHYYPGSHKLPYVMNREYDNLGSKHKLGPKTYKDYEKHIAGIIEETKLKKEVFLAKKGDILIWHANLLHGGEQLIDSNSTRKSMVLHYYCEDAICYHEITQRPSLKQT